MSTGFKLMAGENLPEISLPVVNGANQSIGKTQKEGDWKMIVVYRGLHCPLCKPYLTGLEELLPELKEAGIEVLAISGDPKEKADSQVSEGKLNFPVAYDINPDQMKSLGLYISNPRSPKETDRPFPEPAVFVLNSENKLQIIDISNAPFSRPDLKKLLKGIKFIQANDYPIRGIF